MSLTILSKGILNNYATALTPLSIFSPTDLKLWINTKKSPIVELSGSLISITDLSTNGRMFSQASSPNRPSVSNLGGKFNKVITFNGVDQWIEDTGSIGYYNFLHNTTGKSTIWVVFYVMPATSSSIHTIISNCHPGTTGSPGVEYRYNDFAVNDGVQHVVRNLSGTVITNLSNPSAIATQVWNYVQWISNLSSGIPANRSIMRVLKGSDIQNNSASNTPTNNNPIYMMNIGRSAYSSNYSNIHLADIIIVNKIATAVEVSMMQKYFYKEWGI